MPKKVKKHADLSRTLSWIISIGVHLGLGGIAFFITWSVISIEEEPPRVVTAQWHEQSHQENAKLPMNLPPSEEDVIIPEVPTVQKPTPKKNDGFAVLHQISSSGEIPTFATREPETEVQFMGLDAEAAKYIVYVVDASGSMLLHLSVVLEELERSLRTLHPKQEFGIIFFQQNDAIIVPPRKQLISATADNIDSAMKWISTSGKVIPAGGSNPIRAMKSAMRFKPDVIYLLSENITGAGRYEVPVDELMESLDSINPVDARNGLRRVQINCIQYLSEDPMQTMRKIADIHGGKDGYTFISRGKVVK
ncbi:MAG: hypothetical protein HOC27_08515 [Phycisphaerae bacterium]|jgi:hypothetical protein|nr:hypothetical protein [Phycisphaerae bacterium]